KKPLCYGRVLNVTPVFVNSSNLAYQAHDGPVEDIDQVYDNGVVLVFDTDKTGSEFDSYTVPSGKYATDISRGLFKLGSLPAGMITCDVYGDKTGGIYVHSVADII